MKIPEPIMDPATIIVESKRRRDRSRCGLEFGLSCVSGACAAALGAEEVLNVGPICESIPIPE
jgi:hypothetical protein